MSLSFLFSKEEDITVVETELINNHAIEELQQIAVVMETTDLTQKENVDLMRVILSKILLYIIVVTVCRISVQQ